MKQVRFDFDMFNIMFSLLRDRNDLEDGYWEMSVQTESISASFPQMLQGQRPEVLPGHLVRITGIQMNKMLNPSPLTVEVRDGLVVIPREDPLPIQGELFDGIDRDKSGPVESSQGS